MSEVTKAQAKEMVRIQKTRIAEFKKAISIEAGFANKARKQYTQNLLELMVATLKKYEAMV